MTIVQNGTLVTPGGMMQADLAMEDGKIDITVKRDGKKVELKDVAFETSEENGISYCPIW